MVAPTRVNEEAPQEPTAAGPAGSATAGLTQAEAVVEDPAAPAGDLGESAPAQAGPAEAEPAKAEPAQAEPARLEAAETGQASTAPTEAQHAEAEAAEAAEAAPTEAGEPGLADGEENQAGTARGESRDVRPLAVVGIIVGVIALVGVAAGVLATVTHGFKPKTVVTYRPAAVFGLHPGQCVDAGSSSLSFTLVSCASPHDAEVFARFSLPAATWPGSAAVRQDAGDGCASRLSGYLNPRFATIGLAQEYVYPNHDAWLADQRTVVCEVSSGNGRLTGSVRAQG
jgi:putative regulator of septum formation